MGVAGEAGSLQPQGQYEWSTIFGVVSSSLSWQGTTITVPATSSEWEWVSVGPGAGASEASPECGASTAPEMLRISKPAITRMDFDTCASLNDAPVTRERRFVAAGKQAEKTPAGGRWGRKGGRFDPYSISIHIQQDTFN